MLRFTIVAALLALVGQAAPSAAAPGDLDLTFNGTGKVVTPVGSGVARAMAVTLQSDGKLVAAGSASNGTDLDFAVVRYLDTGALDPSFGGTGIVTTPVRTGDDYGEAVIQQADGKIVVAGYSFDAASSDSTITLVRYLGNGTLDPAFGGGTGKVTTNVSTFYDAAMALLQQTDGKLVVAGYIDTDLAVARYLLDGTLDPAFGGGTGVVTTTVGVTYSTAYAVLQQAGDGKLVVAGQSNTSLTDTVVTLVRYGTDGTPDGTFGTAGVVTTPIGTSDDVAYAIAQQSDGKLVVAGSSNNGTNLDMALVRYDLLGMPDAGFGTGGIVTTSVGSSDDVAYGIAQQADGALVVAGSSKGSNLDVALVRYDLTGMPDAGFGTAGIVTTPIGTHDDEARAIRIQPNGGIVVAGYSNNGSVDTFALARYLSLVGTTTSSTSTTTTSTVAGATTTTPGATTTSTTILAALVPGGPASQTSNDCYLELRVTGVDRGAVQKNQIVVCADGDPCDQGPCGDDRCDVAIAGCTSQTDPTLPGCTPPATLDSARISGKTAPDVSGLLSGPACSAPIQAAIPVKRSKSGKYVAGKSKLVLKGKATAPKGVKPRKDTDKWTIQCMPRTTPCP
jgi:uncharacterized delta-60 repeat protein